MTKKTRKIFSSAFKAKIALEAIQGAKTLNEIGQEFEVHPVQVGKWKKELQDNASSLFDAKRGPKPVEPAADPEKLYTEIGRLKVELDWLKSTWLAFLTVSSQLWGLIWFAPSNYELWVFFTLTLGDSYFPKLAYSYFPITIILIWLRV